jgi:dTDP-4-amino-4,6-dideoxygalactose transaminase
LLEVIGDIGRRGAFIMQEDLAAFERNLAEFVGAKYALGVGNATDALMIGCQAAGLGPGDEVILSSHTMIATAIGIRSAGATPVPVECGSDHLIDPAAVEQAITPRTKAILPTHLNGRTCNMDALRDIAERHGLLIIEDAAQALGSKFKDKGAGSFGIASVFSFYPAKVLGCLGDGGAVLTSNNEMYERLWQLRDFGRNRKGEIVSWGINSRLDNLQAAILDYRLKKFDQVVHRRREIASLYQDALGDVEQLILPPPPDSDPDHFDVYQNYEIDAERRDGLKAFLAEHGIGTLIQWGGVAVHHCRKLGFTQELPYTDYVFQRMLMLPLNMSMSSDEVEYVCEKLRKFYRR